MHHLMLAYTKVVLRSSIFWKPKSLQHQVADFLYFEESYLQGKRIGGFLVMFFYIASTRTLLREKVPS